MSSLKYKVRVLYIFAIKYYKNEVALAKILDIDKCIDLFLQLEDYCRAWLSLFFKDEEIFDKMVNLYLNDINEFDIKKEDFRMPDMQEIIDMYEKTSEEFDLLKTEYIDKNFYSCVDEMVDELYPELKEVF